MGWQSRAKEEKRKEIERVLTKEEKEEIKKARQAKKISIKAEIHKSIDDIDERVIKSNTNLLFLIFRPILFISAGLIFFCKSKSMAYYIFYYKYINNITFISFNEDAKN